jgi:hypothetical protein
MPALPTWVRPDYTPTTYEAHVHYVVLGEFHLDPPIDREHYQSDRVPDGFEFLQYDRDRHAADFAATLNSTAWKLAAPDRPAVAAAAAAAPHMGLLRGVVREPRTLDYLRDSVGIVTYLLDRGGVAVFDPQALYLWEPDVWRREIFAERRPVPHRHVLIVLTPETDGRTHWVHTRGMKLFGRPDLCVRHVGPAFREKVVELLNLYISYQANGGEILDGDVVTLDGLPPDGVCRVDGQLDHPDYGNAHVEIAWPPGGLARA